MSVSAWKVPKSLSFFTSKQAFQTVIYNSNDRFRRNDDYLKSPAFYGLICVLAKGRVQIKFKQTFESERPMTRPAEYTRNLIIKAAVSLFAEKGFERSSVRDIVTKARVNQAAINYHFKGKDGLYLEVLKIAFKTLTEDAGLDAAELKSLSREQALRRFVRHQLRPLLFQDEMSRYIRMFAWESAHPSKVFRKFVATNTSSYLSAALDIVRRFLPPSTQDRAALCAAICLMGQCNVFVRNRELFAQDPFRMTIDEPFVDELSDLITRVAIGGLSHIEDGRLQ
jgi:AcrR family transcriptional regulator